MNAETFVAVAESVDELVFVWKATGELLWSNPAFTRETGMHVDDFGFDNQDNPFIHPEDRPAVLEQMGAFLASDAKRSAPIENRFFDIWGRVRLLSSIVHKIRWQEEDALLLVATLVGGRAEATEADACYRRLVESADDGILKLSREGRVVYSNRRLQQMVGERHVEVNKRTLADVFQPDDRPVAEAALARLRAGETRVSFEARLADGTTQVTVNAGPLEGCAREPAFLAIARDVTEERRVYEQLRQSERQHLENIARVSLFVRDLTNTPLQTLTITSDILRSRFPDSSEMADRLDHTVERLRKLNEALAPLNDVVGLRPEDLSFDALTMIEQTIYQNLSGTGPRKR